MKHVWTHHAHSTADFPQRFCPRCGLIICRFRGTWRVIGGLTDSVPDEWSDCLREHDYPLLDSENCDVVIVTSLLES